MKKPQQRQHLPPSTRAPPPPPVLLQLQLRPLPPRLPRLHLPLRPLRLLLRLVSPTSPTSTFSPNHTRINSQLSCSSQEDPETDRNHLQPLPPRQAQHQSIPPRRQPPPLRPHQHRPQHLQHQQHQLLPPRPQHPPAPPRPPPPPSPPAASSPRSATTKSRRQPLARAGPLRPQQAQPPPRQPPTQRLAPAPAPRVSRPPVVASLRRSPRPALLAQARRPPPAPGSPPTPVPRTWLDMELGCLRWLLVQCSRRRRFFSGLFHDRALVFAYVDHDSSTMQGMALFFHIIRAEGKLIWFYVFTHMCSHVLCFGAVMVMCGERG